MLNTIKVLEFEGLAPSLFVGMVLADYGASIQLVGRKGTHSNNLMNRGKERSTLDLKSSTDIDKLKQMIKVSDVLIDPYRPGVLGKAGLSYEQCAKLNPKIIYASITSFGQSSPIRDKAGHDINFISLSGLLSLCASTGPSNQPAIPANLLGDFAAGGAMATAGILAALIHVSKGGSGQYIDVGMAQTGFYLTQFILNQKRDNMWNNPLGKNLLDGGAHFYNVYKCKDGRYYSVGCIEEKFYSEYLKALQGAGVSSEVLESLRINHLNFSKWEELKESTQAIFITKSRDEWEKVFEKFDCCVSPVVDLEELEFRTELGPGLIWKRDGKIEAQPQPKFSGIRFEQKKINEQAKL